MKDIGIVVAPEPLAAKAGRSIFEKGGNAFDAAVAAAFTQGVVNPFLCGIGGTSISYLYDAKTNQLVTMDASVIVGSISIPDDWEKKYRGRSETVGRFILEGEENQIGYKSIMIPGFVKGAYKIYERFGSRRVSWKQILEPAINYAISGFKVYPYIAKFWQNTEGAEGQPGYPGLRDKLNDPYVRNIYLKNGTDPFEEGDILVQPEYAATLRKIAEGGSDIFYTGEIGKRIAADFEEHDALITCEDLQNYEVLEQEPVTGSYRGFEVLSLIPPATGPQMIQMLQIAEHFDLAAMNPESSDYIELISNIIRIAFQDNVILKNDPPYSIGENLVKKYISKGYAAKCANRIKKGFNDGLNGLKGDLGLGGETTHLTVADCEGNVVSWTHSLGSIAGSGSITHDLGFFYNNFLGHFNPLPFKWDSIVPGKRGGGGVPVLIMKDGKPFIAIGAPGGSPLISSVFQCILNVIDHGMLIEKAVSVPRFHSEENGLIFLEPTYDEEVAFELTRKGYQVKRSTYMSRVQAVHFNGEKLAGGADPRGGRGLEVIQI